MTKLTHLEIENMTCFDKISFDFSDGINVFIGENGTGKTHVLKVIKAVFGSGMHNGQIVNPFSVLPKLLNSFSFFRKTEINSYVNFIVNKNGFNAFISPDHKTVLQNVNALVFDTPTKNSFIPPKDITENSKGFVELNERRELNYSTIYSDILKAAFIPPLRHLDDENFAKIRDKIGVLLGGKPVIENNEFYIEQNGKTIPFTLYSEGLRKFALLKILIENGEIAKDTALIWDEPEANLNPKMLKFLAEILLDLEQAGVQIFLSTHEKALISWLEVKKNQSHKLKYFSLYKTEQGGAVKQVNEETYTELNHNPFIEASDDIFDAKMTKDFSKSDELLGVE